MAGFLGMRGTGDWATDERPLNWRQGILRLYPNGTAPLTAILSKMGEEKVDDPQFHWWTKSLATQRASVTNVFTDAALTTPLAVAGTDGQTLYVQMIEADADQLRAGHQVLLRDASDNTVDVNAKITAVVKSGASSYATVKLLEADDNSSNNNLTSCDVLLVIGSINPEGGAIPDAIAYDPLKLFNYTQIFRTPLEITRTARRTRLRTADAYQEAKREALELHSIELEKAFLWSIRTETTGANGKPERTTLGLIPSIRDNASGNVVDFTQDSDYSGDSWLTSGEEWLDKTLEVIFRFGSMEKLAFVGSGALLGINRLAKTGAQINIKPRQMDFGIKVAEWITPFGSIFMKTHPLFSYEETNRNAMVIFEPKLLKYKYIDDTIFKKDQEAKGTDGSKDEYITECGLEFHHSTAMGYLTGLNTDNALV